LVEVLVTEREKLQVEVIRAKKLDPAMDHHDPGSKVVRHHS
jgi:hypothetical protein